MEIGIYNHHPDSGLPEEILTRYRTLMCKLLPMTLAEKPGPEPSLPDLDEVEISLVDDETIAQVHVDFMNVPGATDVITFPHGEILISLDTAARQAEEFGESVEREIFRYMVHGLLHLHGYLDYTPEDRDAMFAVQERLIDSLWKEED